LLGDISESLDITVLIRMGRRDIQRVWVLIGTKVCADRSKCFIDQFGRVEMLDDVALASADAIRHFILFQGDLYQLQEGQMVAYAQYFQRIRSQLAGLSARQVCRKDLRTHPWTCLTSFGTVCILFQPWISMVVCMTIVVTLGIETIDRG